MNANDQTNCLYVYIVNRHNSASALTWKINRKKANIAVSVICSMSNLCCFYHFKTSGQYGYGFRDKIKIFNEFIYL